MEHCVFIFTFQFIHREKIESETPLQIPKWLFNRNIWFLFLIRPEAEAVFSIPGVAGTPWSIDVSGAGANTVVASGVPCPLSLPFLGTQFCIPFLDPF